MKLITESAFDSTIVLTEEVGPDKNYFVEGVFIQSDVLNGNRRVYPGKLITEQVKSYNEKFVDQGRALGELDHPTSPEVNLERVSHNLVELKYINKTDVYGKAKLLDTPYGNIAKSFVRERIKLGVSTRGIGSVTMIEGVSTVSSDFLMTAIDLVGSPSAPSAFVNGIMEGQEWVVSNGEVLEQAQEELRKQIDEDTRAKGALFAESSIFKNLDRILANSRLLK